MRTLSFFTLAVALLFLSGCGGDKSRPTDLPKLFPVSITITQGDAPLAGATVTLNAKTPSKYGTSSGTTDASGIAKFKTYGYDGVPAGDYTVTVAKVGVEGAKEVVAYEGEAPQMVGGTSYQYVDAKFTKGDTGLTITVTEKGGKATFDVGAAVKTSLGRAD